MISKWSCVRKTGTIGLCFHLIKSFEQLVELVKGLKYSNCRKCINLSLEEPLAKAYFTQIFYMVRKTFLLGL